MKLKAKVTIYAGTDVFAPGDMFFMKDRREARSLVDRGFADLVMDEPKQEAAPALTPQSPRSARASALQVRQSAVIPAPVPLPFAGGAEPSSEAPAQEAESVPENEAAGSEKSE